MEGNTPLAPGMVRHFRRQRLFFLLIQAGM
jgi:hypothetical protein